MRAITDMGATLEFHYICTSEMMGNAATVNDFVAAVEAVGPENAVMATDGGATANPPAMEQFKRFIRAMLGAGISESDVRTMVAENPKRIFNLD
jgi:predicted metal-dependent phosphotriesterase family hydrolase